MRKGITPVISIIILLLITVALAGAAWAFLSGFLGTYTEKSFTVPTGGAFCDSNQVITVNFVNTGTSTITSIDWGTPTIDPAVNCTGTPTPSTSVPSKGMGNITVIGCDPGVSYIIHMGTLGGSQHVRVTC